jgi:hypothetical protein
MISTNGLEFSDRKDRWLLRSGAGWNPVFLGIVVCLAGYIALEHPDLWMARPTLRRQVTDAGQQGVGARKGRVLKRTAVAGGSDVAAAEQPVAAKGGDSAPSPVRVWSGTDGQTAEAESMCSRVREVRGEHAFRACVRAQLAVIMNLSSAPDLIGLSAGERESIESVCNGGMRVRGSDGYNQCLNVQTASLAEEPSRPDFSGLNDADRSSVEAACKNAKYSDGPAAYDRCLTKYVKMLAEAK